MSGRLIVFLDRDGTLNEETADEQIDSLEKIRLMPGVIPALLELKAAGFAFVMVTNQDGIGTASFPFERFEVYGMHSTYETFEMEKISITSGLATRTTTHDFSLASMHEKWGYIEEDRLFVDALEGKSAAPVTADDGYNVVELIEACYSSARKGERVHLGTLVK